jgi:hypothetical protein
VGLSHGERLERVRTSFWERLAPFDGQWYQDIEQRGYRSFDPSPGGYRPGRPPGNYAFFPLLPAVLRVLKAAFGPAALPAAILFLAVSSALGVAVAWRLARELSMPGGLVAALLIAFPTAVFQLVLYPEALFLALSSAALLLALRRRAALCAATGALAGLSRPQGVLLVLPFFVELVLPVLRRGGGEPAGKWRVLGRGAAALCPLAGFAVLAAASWSETSHALSFLGIQERWGRSFEPWGFAAALGSAVGYTGPRADILGLAFGLGLVPVLWKRLPRSLALFGTAMAAMPLATGSLMSMGRFLSVSAPHFLALALCVERFPRAARAGIVGALAAAQVLVARGLIGWYFVG